jgi:hypothetical protein
MQFWQKIKMMYSNDRGKQTIVYSMFGHVWPHGYVVFKEICTYIEND